MDTTFTFLGLTAHAYGLCAAIGVAVLLCVMGVLGYQRHLPAGTVRMFGLMAIPMGLIGARLMFCLFNWSVFTETFENPWLMLCFFDGGLSMVGLLIGMILAALLTSKVMKTSFRNLLDVMCVPLGLMLAVLRTGEAFTDLGVGKVVSEGWMTAHMPWLFLQSKMGINIEFRLNVSKYEALFCALIFVAVLMIYRRGMRKKDKRAGDAALLFFTLYGCAQIVLESMRDDGHMQIIFLRISQLSAAIMVLTVCAVLSKRYLHLKPDGQKRIVLTWIAMTLCVLGVVVLEFSLDGRLTFGTPSLLRDYSIMTALAAVMCVLPCSLLVSLRKKLYGEERMSVHVG